MFKSHGKQNPSILQIAVKYFSRVIPSSWYGRVCLVSVILVVILYFIREWIRLFVIGPLGFGVIPLILWLSAMVWSIYFRRSWLRRMNLWIAALVLIAVGMGVLAFFESDSTIANVFTNQGEVTLGGQVGENIIGSTGPFGIFRLLGLVAIASTISMPSRTIDLGILLGRCILYTYFNLVIAGKNIRRLYSKNSVEAIKRRESKSVTYESQDVLITQPGSGFSETSFELSDGRMSPEIDSPLSLNQSKYPLTSLPAPHSIPESSENELTQQIVSVEDTVFQLNPKDTDLNQSSGKFNKFWTSPDDQHTSKSPEQERIELYGKPWKLPSRELLKEIPEAIMAKEQLTKTAETIKRTLSEYGVEVEIGHTRPGPTVTMYGLIPGWIRRYKQTKQIDESGRPKLDESGKQIVKRVEEKTRVKVDSILAREKDLALALKTPSIRIETPVMGEAQVGIEVPNPNPGLVSLRTVMESAEFRELQANGDLPVALGKGSGGETMAIDLAKMPHLLIAGATGSGKSVCINTIVSCLIMEKSPADLRLLLIDPKRVELTPYNGIPHLITPVVVETDQVVGLLKGMIQEMQDRYRLLEQAGVRNIASYNKNTPNKMPFLVIAVDELADLMMSAAFDIEQSLCRLAQLGRATGIHLIVATQRPSVDVVTGLIKANFPSRISFGVTSQIDSRTILDATGADKLLGRGDMLYLPLDASKPIRAQDVFISDHEIESIVAFWKSTPPIPIPRIEILHREDHQSGNKDRGSIRNDQDKLLEKAVELAQAHNKVSTSLLQRRLRIGYPRAARIMDELEEQGIIGPSDGSKSRDVIIR